MIKKFFIFIFAASVVLAGIFWFKLLEKENAWVCENNVWVQHGNPNEPKPTEPCGEPNSKSAPNPTTATTSTSNLPAPASSTIDKPALPNEIVVDGLYVCLPKKTDGPSTEECRLGIMTDEGIYYSLDTNRLPSYIEYPTGTRLHLEGIFTPIEMISSNLGKIYDIKGIITVLKVNEDEQ